MEFLRFTAITICRRSCLSARRLPAAGATRTLSTAIIECKNNNNKSPLLTGKIRSKLENKYQYIIMGNKQTKSLHKSTLESMGVKQLFDDESSTFTYLLWDPKSKDGILIDPVDTQVERDLKVVEEEGVNLIYGVNTHAHADHITGTGHLKSKVGSLKSVISKASKAMADIHVEHGDKIEFGERHITVRATPGHTEGCVSFVTDDETMVFTGDTLLIQGCGRTDFQGGSAASLYDSVWSQILTLPDDCIVYPAHDYKGRLSSKVIDEKTTNPRLGQSKTKEEFVEIMANLNLSYPKKIDVAVPANMRCGVPDVEYVVPT